MATPDIFNPGRERVQALAAPNIVTEQARNDPQANVNALVSALGADSVQRELANFNQQHEARKLEEQRVKFDWYVDQFEKDHTSGAVSQAQIKERFPETVPIISSRIAEALGQKAGKAQMQAAIDEVVNNDALRLDSMARAAFLAKKRQEITASVGTGNEFYGAGMVSAIDKATAQHEMNWQTETAAYHQKVQADQFSGEVVEAFNAGKPEALLAADAKFKVSSSLNDLERNKIVVNSAIDLAAINDDPSILKAVPQRFLNVGSKAALEKTRVQLIDRRMADYKNARILEADRRSDQQRASQMEILAAVASGKPVDPMQYRSSSEAFQFAIAMREAPRLDESTSVGNAQSIRNMILTQSGTGEMTGSVQSFTDQLVANPNLNPKERQKLIEELPKLVEGRNLMADDMVRQPISDRLNPRLTALESSTNSSIQSLLTGRNLRSEVMKGYDLDIRRSFNAEYEETGKWPTGHRKLDLIDKAVDRAEKRLEDATKIGGPNAAPAPPAVAPRAAVPTPTAPKTSPSPAAIAAELARRQAADKSTK